jgi:hypothetical protein
MDIDIGSFITLTLMMETEKASGTLVSSSTLTWLSPQKISAQYIIMYNVMQLWNSCDLLSVAEEKA